VSSGSKVFDALLRRKSAEPAEAFIESDDLRVLFDNRTMFCKQHAQIISGMCSDVKLKNSYLLCL
jgi:hypothetical protein